MKKYLLRLLVLALFAFATPAVWAQVTTSAINGTITDPTTKETLIGASVVAKHLPTGTTYGAITNAKGNFSIVGMRPGGPYTLTISYIGYQSAKIENVNLALGETETFNIEMKDDTKQLTTVVVTGAKGNKFNSQKTGAGSAFSRKNIERVPTVSRSIMDIAKLTPQANGSGSFAGANSRFNSFQIDGAVNNDVFGLGTSGKNAISLEAIDALQVVIAPFDVRQSGFTGGGMNAITKSGTNTFHGSVYDYYYNQDFFGTTAGKDVKTRKALDKQYENTVGFTLGGPILRDKLFFFANGEYVKGIPRPSPQAKALSSLRKMLRRSLTSSRASATMVVATLRRISPAKPSRGWSALTGTSTPLIASRCATATSTISPTTSRTLLRVCASTTTVTTSTASPIPSSLS